MFSAFCATIDVFMKKFFAISDLHLSFQVDKPMNVFGKGWDGYEERIRLDWNAKVGKDDVGIIAGDISWAMNMNEAQQDFEYIKKLNGKKIIVRGNHDYWWKSITRIREELGDSVYVLQNDAVRIDGVVYAGTRGWRVPERYHTQKSEDKKIFDREVIRLELALKDAKTKMQESDKLVVVLHYPPFNSGRDDSPFTKLCEQFDVDACVYGHLHGRLPKDGLETVRNRVRYVLTSCDLLEHKVMEIEL